MLYLYIYQMILAYSEMQEEAQVLINSAQKITPWNAPFEGSIHYDFAAPKNDGVGNMGGSCGGPITLLSTKWPVTFCYFLFDLRQMFAPVQTAVQRLSYEIALCSWRDFVSPVFKPRRVSIYLFNSRIDLDGLSKYLFPPEPVTKQSV